MTSLSVLPHFFDLVVDLFLLSNLPYTSSLHVSMSSAHSPLNDRYLDRLGLSPTTNVSTPSLTLLQTLQEQHLATIPFENTAQHGVTQHGPAVLDIKQNAYKVLDCHRGGVCYEVNSLFSSWLEELGYIVFRVPAYVYVREAGFRPEPTHMILMVQCSSTAIIDMNNSEDDKIYYYVDVGFGEPPLQPLKYNRKYLSGIEQTTCDGMRSRFRWFNETKCNEGDTVLLEWFRDGAWQPRLKWSYAASMCNTPLKVFDQGLKIIQQPDSNFSQRLICCLLTRDCKLTLAGNAFKTTQPRGLDGITVEPIIAVVESNEEGRYILKRRFGIPLQASNGLDLGGSQQSYSSTGYFSQFQQ